MHAQDHVPLILEDIPVACNAQAVVVYDDKFDNVHALLLQLSPNDAEFLTQLGSYLVSNFAEGCFSVTDLDAIYQIFRFTMLGRTALCRMDAPLYRAHELCDQHSIFCFDSKPVVVFDLVAKSIQECVLAQHELCRELLGPLTNGKMLTRPELLRFTIAVGGAYHRPGVEFKIYNQEIGCNKLFDIMYYVDPETFFLMVVSEEAVVQLRSKDILAH